MNLNPFRALFIFIAMAFASSMPPLAATPASPAAAQNPTVLTTDTMGASPAYRPHPPRLEATRRALALSGPWRLRFDPKRQGERERWFESGLGPQAVTAQVPGCFNMQFPERRFYKGVVFYERSFSVPREWPAGQPLYLRFQGALQRARVWVNGRLAGEHPYPHTGFEFDVTPLARRDRPNTLIVAVDNAAIERAIPDPAWDGWWFYGGLTREVFLEQRPAASVANLWLDTQMKDGGWAFAATAVVAAAQPQAAPVPLMLSLEDAKGQRLWSAEKTVSLAAGGTTSLTLTGFLKDVRPWSPESPTLYRLCAEIFPGEGRPGPSRAAIRTGFRQIQTSGTQILLNGLPLQLRGINRHEDYKGVGPVLSPARTRRDLEDVRRLGCNFLRVSHYMQEPLLYDLCDELGLLVWAEIPAWKTRAETLADPWVYAAYARPQLAEMVAQLRHHPSVVIWAVGNEFPSDKPEVADYVKRACDYVRGLDPTRLVTFASDRHLRDRAYAHVDFIAVNEYFGWMHGGSLYDTGWMLDRIHAMAPTKPILVSEFGSEGIPGQPDPSPWQHIGMNFSEAYQCKYAQAHLEQIFDPRRRAWMAGAVLWVYNDYPDPHRWGGGRPEKWSYVSMWGLVTEDRQRKPAYELVRRFYHDLARDPLLGTRDLKRWNKVLDRK